MSVAFKFCPSCGRPLDKAFEGGHRRMQCAGCSFVHYMNPSPAAGVLVFDGDRVLLVRRRYEPYKGLWSIPSGFIEYEEEVRETARRELLEETGLAVELDSLYTVESCFDDPRGITLLVLYRGHIAGGELAAGDDAEDVRFFPLSELPDIAFEVHREVLTRLAKNPR